MSDEELRAIRDLERRLEAVGSQRSGVLYEVAQLTKGMADSLRLHHAADERASKDLARELEGLRGNLRELGESVATLVERSQNHDRQLKNHELVLGACALLMLAARLAHWL